MEYSNPKIPEEINYSKENPLKEFAQLLGGIAFLLVVVEVAANFLAQNFAQYIPFEYEKKILSAGTGLDQDNEHYSQQVYLNKLAEKLVMKMNLPEEMHIQVALNDSEDINAAATLNGQIYINQGLFDFVKSENELAFILCHEIAHIRQRHPIKSLSSGVILSILAAIVSGSIENGDAANIIVTSTTLTSLSFSRAQEQEADDLALGALYKHYGHINGSLDFFMRMNDSDNYLGFSNFISTHPGIKKRIKRIRQLANELKYKNNTDATLIALPAS